MRRAALLLLALGSLLAASTTAAAPAAGATGVRAGTATASSAAAAGASVLTLSAVTPPVASPGVAVTITGTVTARTTALSAPTVQVVLGSPPALSRAAVAAWPTSTSPLSGLEVGSTKMPGPVAVGATVPFSIRVPAGRFVLNRPFGAIPFALQVRDSASGTTEVLRTFVGWQRSKQYEPLLLAVVAPVTLSPTSALWDTDPQRRLTAWQSELAPGSRLNRVLDGTDVDGPAGPVPVTWAVDPDVVAPPPTPAPAGQPDQLAGAVAPLVTRLATGAGRHVLWALPRADADLAAAVGARPDDPTVTREVQASTELGRTLGVPVTTGIAWPADGGLAPGREDGLRTAYDGLGLAAVVASASALPSTSGFSGQAARRSPSGLPVLAWDDTMSALTLDTRTAAEGATTAQRLVAETAVLLGESPGVSRSFLLALPRTVDPDPGALKQVLGTMAQTPWVSFTTTTKIQEQAAAKDPVAATTAGSWTLAGPAQLDANLLEWIERQRRSVEEVSTVLGDNGQAYRAQWFAMLDQMTSVRWRANPDELRRLEAAVTAGVAAATQGISVVPQTTNFLADQGTLQVTVVNSLPVPVTGVHLVLTPGSPRLRVVSQPAPVTIGANSRAVIPVQVEALAAGLVPVTAGLTTEDGTAIGVPGTITVRANPPGYSFYVVGGVVVVLVLLAGIVRTIRRPRRPAVAPRAEAVDGHAAPVPEPIPDRPVG